MDIVYLSGLISGPRIDSLREHIKTLIQTSDPHYTISGIKHLAHLAVRLEKISSHKIQERAQELNDPNFITQYYDARRALWELRMRRLWIS